MFSAQVIKNLYCHGITLVCCRYIGCSEVGFSQLNRAAETEIMIPVFPLSAWSTHSPGSTLAASQEQKGISTFSIYCKSYHPRNIQHTYRISHVLLMCTLLFCFGFFSTTSQSSWIRGQDTAPFLRRFSQSYGTKTKTSQLYHLICDSAFCSENPSHEWFIWPQ